MTDKYREFYNEVYGKNDTAPVPFGWIQWKGTDVCIDLHCSCGHHGHVDRSFFYFFKCPKCQQKFAVGQSIRLLPLTPELIELGGIEEDRFVTCELDEDE